MRIGTICPHLIRLHITWWNVSKRDGGIIPAPELPGTRINVVPSKVPNLIWLGHAVRKVPVAALHWLSLVVDRANATPSECQPGHMLVLKRSNMHKEVAVL